MRKKKKKKEKPFSSNIHVTKSEHLRRNQKWRDEVLKLLWQKDSTNLIHKKDTLGSIELIKFWALLR